MGAVLAALCGLALWGTSLGDGLTNASYDYQFRFGTRGFTNKVVLVLMDNHAFNNLHQVRGQPWDRALHAKLLNKLADDGCPLVVFDVFFDRTNEPATDETLAAAMQRVGAVVLMADLNAAQHPGQVSASPALPAGIFVEATHTNWGVAARLDPGEIVRRHWPFPSPGTFESLPWAAARLAGATPGSVPEERWLRYYGAHGALPKLSYDLAFDQPAGYFRDKLVFIGQWPEMAGPGKEADQFDTPFTGSSVGGVELLATTFLNLLNGNWLRRPDWRLEAILILGVGLILGGGLCQVRLRAAIGIAIAASVALLVSAACVSCCTNFWFPWLVIVGGTVPSALGWALAAIYVRSKTRAPVQAEAVRVPVRVASGDQVERVEADARNQSPATAKPPRFSGWETVLAVAQGHDLPDAPDYEVFAPPFGEGGFGKVWLARNAIGQWQALKAVYQSKFGKKTAPYEAEFKGIKRYKPISDKHPGLLRVDFVSKKKPEGYFYYVMELGDAQQTGWEEDPSKYKPRDLAGVRSEAPEGRLPVQDCARMVLVLAEALEFLHGQGLTHRDIKPSNIIFVNGRPKLTDVGLVTDLRPPEEITTYAGSPGYMPPPPEPPGTAQADIYGLGMVLYVISTGRNPAPFSSLSSSLLERKDQAEFLKLSDIVLKACQPDCALRYKTATDLRADLLQLANTLEPRQVPNR